MKTKNIVFSLHLLLAGLWVPGALASQDGAALLLDLHTSGCSQDQVRQLVVSPHLEDDALLALTGHGDWRVRYGAKLVLGWRQHPELYKASLDHPAASTRSGHLRFLGSEVNDPRLAPLYVARLLRGEDRPEVRIALAEVLPRTGDEHGEAIVALLAEEPAAEVRVVLVAGLRSAEAEWARAGFALAIEDAHASVRAEAARTMGWRSDGRAMVPGLLAALGDRDLAVRGMALRSLGWLKAVEAWSDVLPFLNDDAAEVRLRALRALEGMDPIRAASEPKVRALSADPDPAVARAAVSVTGVGQGR